MGAPALPMGQEHSQREGGPVKRRRRGDDARDETSPEPGFEHSSRHADLGSLLDEHSYGPDAEAAIVAWLESRRRPGDGSAQPARSSDELRRVLDVLESVDAERAERSAQVTRPDPRVAPARVTAPAP